MNRNNGGLHVAMRPGQDGSKLHSAAAGIPVGLVLLAGAAVTAAAWFPSIQLPWPTLFLGMLACAALLWLLRLTGIGRWGCAAVLALDAAACLVFRERVLAGMGCLGNDLLDRLTSVTGRIWLDFAIASDSAVMWGVIPLLGVAVVLLHLGVQTGKVLYLLPVLVPAYAGALTGLVPVEPGLVLLGLGTILLLAQGSGIGHFRGVPAWLAVVLLCGAVSAGAAWTVGDAEGKTGLLDQYMHTRLYDRDTNSMPEGDLQNLGQWDKSETPALQLTMTQPQKLYLRGQIYETYEGTAWLPLSAEERAEYESLFYWLHQSGFFGQSQIALASAFTEQQEPAEMTIENLSACGAHGYSPYAVYGSEGLDASLAGDTALPAADSLRYLPGSVPQWYEVQQALAANQEQGDIAGYLAAEQAYEEYVTQMDLQLTNESWSVLNRQLGEGESPKTLSGIREFIRTYLSEALVYDEDVRTLNGSGDFLQYTLEMSGSGYSVHYATAAVLMLRYFGVPARYVEGYYLSAEEAASYGPGQPMILTEEHAHAWAEYYLPGVGFVPFEVTPGYVDDEESELGSGGTRNEQTYMGDHLQYAQVEQPERMEELRQDRFSFAMKPVYLVYGLAVVLAVFAVMILVRRKKFRKAMDEIHQASNRDAIAMGFGYAVKLLNSCPDLRIDGVPGARMLNREALFSNHRMTDAQRRAMDAFVCHVLAECKKQWTIPQKLRYWAWDCLY